MAFRQFHDSFISLFGAVVGVLSWYGVKQWPEKPFFQSHPWVGNAFCIVAIASAVYLLYSLFRNTAKPGEKEGVNIVEAYEKIWALADVGRDLCHELQSSGKIKSIAGSYSGEITAFFDSKRYAVYSELSYSIDKNFFKLAKSANESKRKKKEFIAEYAQKLDRSLDFKGTEEFIKMRRELAFGDVERFLSHELTLKDRATYIAHLCTQINGKIAELKKRRRYWKLTYLFFPDLKKLMTTRFDEERFFSDPHVFELLLINSLKIEKLDAAEVFSGSIMAGIFMMALPDVLSGTITDALWDELGFNLGAEFVEAIGLAVDFTGILLLVKIGRWSRHLWRWISGQAFKDFKEKVLSEVYSFVNETKKDAISNQQKACETLVAKLNDTFTECQMTASKKIRKYTKII